EAVDTAASEETRDPGRDGVAFGHLLLRCCQRIVRPVILRCARSAPRRMKGRYARAVALRGSALARLAPQGDGDRLCCLVCRSHFASCVRKTRCRILPVAVRGMSWSLMNEIERGLL